MTGVGSQDSADNVVSDADGLDGEPATPNVGDAPAPGAVTLDAQIDDAVPGDAADRAEGVSADGAPAANSAPLGDPAEDDAVFHGLPAQETDTNGDSNSDSDSDSEVESVDGSPGVTMPDAGAPAQDLALPDAQPMEPSDFMGHFDAVEPGGWAAGWARRSDNIGKASLDIYVDGEWAGDIVADQFRPDLIQTGFPDPNCAFWFGIPEVYFDGQTHNIDIRFGGTDQSIAGSPRDFTIDSQAQDQPAPSDNILPNATFTQWPNGLSVRPTERMAEPLAGWFFDYRRGTRPAICLSVDRPRDLALKPDHFALSIAVEEGGTDGFMRLIVPLDVGLAEIDAYRLSLGVRCPANAPNGALHINEIFLGSLNGAALERIATIRRNIKLRGTQRLHGLKMLGGLKKADEANHFGLLALVIELSGNGEMLLFSPEISLAPSLPRVCEDVAGDFEDPNIRGQVHDLTLGPLWTSRRPAAGGLNTGADVRPVIEVNADRSITAMPFIPIVVPVFNASSDVEDLLRSILRETDSPFEILLFDDGSEPFAQSRISRWQSFDSRVRYYRQPDNVGYTRNINMALQSVNAEFAVLINSDTVVTPGWLRKLYQVMIEHPRIAAVGPLSNAASWQSLPQTKTPNGEWVVNTFPEEFTPAAIASIVESASDGSAPSFPLLNGFCTLLRRSALEDVGYYDDASFPRGYGEENDLCLRLTKAGYELRVATDAYVHHKKSKSFGVGQRMELSKKANMILRGKHPEVSFPDIEEKMRIDPAVNRIRTHLAQALGVEPLSAGAKGDLASVAVEAGEQA